MLGEQGGGDWESAGIIGRVVSCFLIGMGIGSIVFMPLLSAAVKLLWSRPEALKWMVMTFGSESEFFAYYFLSYSFFTGTVLFILQRGWR